MPRGSVRTEIVSPAITIAGAVDAGGAAAAASEALAKAKGGSQSGPGDRPRALAASDKQS